MKKNERKIKPLQLNRETLVRLGSQELTKAQGGFLYQDAMKCSGCDSGCGIFD
jgi:hypothetical protein